jgi:hypothetical protein
VPPDVEEDVEVEVEVTPLDDEPAGPPPPTDPLLPDGPLLLVTVAAPVPDPEAWEVEPVTAVVP